MELIRILEGNRPPTLAPMIVEIPIVVTKIVVSTVIVMDRNKM